MGYLTYTRDYNTLTLKIPQTSSENNIHKYTYYTLKVEINGQEDLFQRIDVDHKIAIPIGGASQKIKIFPFEMHTLTVTWHSNTTSKTQSEVFTYIPSFDGHILLSGQDKYLPLLYNPEATNLKWNYIDTVTPTLGGTYPVVTRNGNQKYRTFTLGGMISYELDEPQSNLFSGYQFLSKNEINNYRSYSQSVDEQDLLIERVFRDAVAAWLQNGQKKVFQSEQEGTMIVYLSNFSWTSNKTLGRHNYSFSCTATEVEEATTANIEAVLK